jgi:hypothetical protein
MPLLVMILLLELHQSPLAVVAMAMVAVLLLVGYWGELEGFDKDKDTHQHHQAFYNDLIPHVNSQAIYSDLFHKTKYLKIMDFIKRVHQGIKQCSGGVHSSM